MFFKDDEMEFEIVIEKKKIKNTYIKIKDDGVVYITTNYLVSDKQIEKLIKENINYIKKNVKKMKNKQERSNDFYYLGKKYEINFVPTNSNTIVESECIITKNEKTLEKWLQEEIKRIYKARLYYYYQLIKEDIPYPKLKFRKMKTRWGVCNRRDNSVTLNTELIKYNIEALDYVIVHELSHFIYFDHSKNFWNQVSKYFPNYKEVRKYLKD